MSLDVQLYRSIIDVPVKIWDSLAPRRSVSLETDHLRAIEMSNINNLIPYYILVYKAGIPIAIAYFFITEIDFSALSNDIKPDTRTVLKYWYPNFMNLKVIECGIISGLGEGITVSDVSLHSAALLTISQEMEKIAKQDGAEVILWRDIPWKKYPIYKPLEDKGYMPLPGFPTTMLPIMWDCFENYMASLKRKTRWNIRHCMSKLQDDAIEVDTIVDFGEFADRMAFLWDQTNQHATDYDHEKLTAKYFYEINRHLPSRSRIVAIRHNKKIIGFYLGFLGDEEYFAAHTGFDYSYNEKYSLYFSMTYSVLDDAFRSGMKRINMGLTTYDFKFRIGFEAQGYIYLAKHVERPSLTVTFTNLLRDSIQQPENYHRPFKNQDIIQRVQLSEMTKSLQSSNETQDADVFHKTYGYERANTLRLDDLYAFFPTFESAQNPVVQHKGQQVVMLGTNSYLGLGTHPEVCAAAKKAINKYGTGCSGSPFLNGTLDIHVKLARSLAEFVRKGDALLFSTGYQTNIGVISAIAGRNDVVIMDKLNHASLVDGVRMSSALIERFRHNDIAALEKALQKYPDRAKFVVVDAVFSMEGTMSNLPAIVALVKRYGARLMVDEAHAIGVLGPGGRGVAEHFNLLEEVDIVMGTFSKSFASIGGFVAGDGKVIECLRHVARSHMFSASLPPPAVAAVQKALDIAQNEPERRKQVLENAKYMATGLQKLGYVAPFQNTAIIPIYCHDELITLGLYKKLLDQGVFVNPVLFPAVAKGQEMLRTSYMATHTVDLLKRALDVFAEVRTPYFPDGSQITKNSKAMVSIAV